MCNAIYRATMAIYRYYSIHVVLGIYQPFTSYANARLLVNPERFLVKQKKPPQRRVKVM